MDGEVRRAATSAVGKGRQTRGKRIPPPPDLRDEITIERVDDPAPAKAKKKRPKPREVDVSDVQFPDVAPSTAQKLQRRLAEAALAFEAERFTEADNLLASIERLSPGVPEVIEIRGLTFYRLGHWAKAINQFEAFHERTGSVEQHPVWADCCRALRRWTKAEELWIELGDASPSAELVEEGRIVQAGTLADRDRLADAIRLLESAPKPPRRPGLHHLRRWYVLGDLYERSGEFAHARRVFTQIIEAEPGFGDAAERLAALG
ncbi:MAG: tetratricopeptide repeat protein [Actinomycetota bacterium]